MHLIDITANVVEPEQTWNPIDDVFFVLYTRQNPTGIFIFEEEKQLMPFN